MGKGRVKVLGKAEQARILTPHDDDDEDEDDGEDEDDDDGEDEDECLSGQGQGEGVREGRAGAHTDTS